MLDSICSQYSRISGIEGFINLPLERGGLSASLSSVSVSVSVSVWRDGNVTVTLRSVTVTLRWLSLNRLCLSRF